MDILSRMASMLMDPGINQGMGTGPMAPGYNVYPGTPAAQEFAWRDAAPPGVDMVAGAGMPLAGLGSSLLNGITVYRGGTPLKSNKSYKTDSGWYGEGIYFSDSVDTAKVYSKKDNNLYKGNIELKKPFEINYTDLDKAESTMNSIKKYGLEFNAWGMPKYPDKFTETLKRKGHDGIIISKYNEPKEYVVFSPESIMKLDLLK